MERLAWFDPPSNPGSTLLMHRQPDDLVMDAQPNFGTDLHLGRPHEAVECVRDAAIGRVLERHQAELLDVAARQYGTSFH